MLNKLKCYWEKTNRWHRVFLIFLIVEFKLLPGGKVGFLCNDPALSHPYTGDTVSFRVLLAVTLTLPLIVLIFVERIQDKTEFAREQVLRWYKEYLFGFLFNVTLVQSIKLFVGSPRPHFFDTCRPVEAQTCETSQYIYDYQCTKAHWLNQSDKSFPSGHSSLAFHAGIFIAYYIHQRTIASKRTVTAQVVCLLTAVYCAVSRMTDHRHHWWDVLAGLVIAIIILGYTIFFSCRNFECLITKNEPKIEIKKEEKQLFTNSIVEETS